MSLFRPIVTFRRGYAAGWGGMTGLWDKLKNGFSRSDAIVSKIKAERQGGGAQQLPQKEQRTSNAASPSGSIDNSNKVPGFINPWDRPTKATILAPELFWMQSSFVRGSTQKMTGMARQIIGLPLDAALLQMRFSPKKKAESALTVLSNMRALILARGGNPAFYYVKSATVGRGTYLKRLDIRARGRHGVQWRGHTFIRICCWKPDPEVLVRKMLKIKKIPREDKPITKKLDYY